MDRKKDMRAGCRSDGHRPIRELFSWVMVVVCAFVLAFVVTHYVIIKAEVPTGSMISTIQVGDRLILSPLDIAASPFPEVSFPYSSISFWSSILHFSIPPLPSAVLYQVPTG